MSWETPSSSAREDGGSRRPKALHQKQSFLGPGQARLRALALSEPSA